MQYMLKALVENIAVVKCIKYIWMDGQASRCTKKIIYTEPLKYILLLNIDFYFINVLALFQVIKQSQIDCHLLNC